jgi:SAM-dependent methyltransferase
MFESREGLRCLDCGAVWRFRFLASEIMKEFGARRLGCETFSEYTDTDHFKSLQVAEINGCGVLHEFLARNPSLAYSEYASEDPQIPSQDLHKLSYRDQQFDLVITSDTLEHVPNLEIALAEIERVLKPGGRHIFTIPVVWDGRKTRQRALFEGNRIVHLHPPSYHGIWSEQSSDRLVIHEFGDDVLEYVTTARTETTVSKSALNPSLSVFVAVKRRDRLSI